MISLHNSYSEYGIYHSWRQYQEMKTNVTIYFRYRTGRNANYDPNSSGSSEYSYSNIPYTANNGPIIGIYNGNTLIYCSAYYRGTTLTNTLGTYISMKLPAGTYTIRVMRLGKGLVLGESGESMMFTVDRFDRTIDQYTGEYNKYNNYGYISEPSKQVYFDFDYEGLSFDMYVSYEEFDGTIDKYPGVTTRIYKWPSYSDVKAAMDAAYAETGMHEEYDYVDYKKDVIAGNGSYGPVRITDEYKIEPIYTEIPKLVINKHVGFDNITELANIDISRFTGTYSQAQASPFISAAYYKVCQENGLEFDVEKDLTWYSIESVNSYAGQYLIDASSSDYVEYIVPVTRYHLINYESQSDSTRYVTSAVRAFKSIGTVPDEYWSSCIRPYCTYNSRSKTAITQEIRIRHWNGDSPTDTVYTTRMDYLNLSFWRNGYVMRIRGVTSSWEEYKGYDDDALIPEVMEGRCSTAAQLVSEKARPLIDSALTNFNKTTGDGLDSWYELVTRMTGITVNGVKQPQVYRIPLACLFGDMPPEAMGYRAIKWLDGVDDTFSVTTDGDNINKKFFTLPVGESLIYNPYPNGFNIDLTGYEFCKDYTTGWVNTNNGPLVLRQTVIDIDLSDVPDHQITPN